jgi:hypothetical protein
MNILQAIGILLLGAGLGALLTWLQQTAVRKQFLQELEAQVDQALFSRLRSQRLLNIRRTPSSGPPAWSAPPEAVPTDAGFRGHPRHRGSVVLSG